MQPSIHFQKDIAAPLRDDLIPAVRENRHHFLLATPPLHPPKGISVTPRRFPPLSTHKKTSAYLTVRHWPAEGMVTARFPTLLVVLEGEADIRIGVTREMANAPGMAPGVGRYVVSLPHRSFLLIPQGIPRSDASQPHWERENIQEAHSRLLWIHVMPAGLSLHMCSTDGIKHSSTPAVFVNDARSDGIVEALMEEMGDRTLHHEELARGYLLSLLLRIDRGLATRSVLSREEGEPLLPTEKMTGHVDHPTAGTPVQRARHYIETHLNERLTPELIASRIYVSVSHLNRLFHAELDMTVMKYVLERRLEMARSLLQETDLPVQRLSAVSGFLHHAHFCRAFLSRYGVSPTEFRRRQRRQKPARNKNPRRESTPAT